MTQPSVHSAWDAVQATVYGLVKKQFVVSPKLKSENFTTLNPVADPLGQVAAYLEETDLNQSIAVLAKIEDIFKGITHFTALRNSPVVFHALVSPDFGIVSALRHSGFVFIQSFGPEDAQDMAVAAHVVALLLKKPVVHFFPDVAREAPRNWSNEQIARVLANIAVEDGVDVETTQPNTNGSVNGTHDAKAESPEIKKFIAEEAIETAFDLIGGKYSPFQYHGDSKATEAIVVFGDADVLSSYAAQEKFGIVTIRVYSPFSAGALFKVLPKSVTSLALLDQTLAKTTTWLPLLQDILSADTDELSQITSLASFQLGDVDDDNVKDVFKQIRQGLLAKPPVHNALIGNKFTATSDNDLEESISGAYKLEDAYFKVLNQLFPHLSILNASEQPNAGLENVPEYGFGAYLAQQDALADTEFASDLRTQIRSGKFDDELTDLLQQWVNGNHSLTLSQKIQSKSKLDSSKFQPESSWLIGSDAWSYDLGNSGLYNVLRSKRNVNMLIIDSTPQSELSTTRQRKKDIGLFAMGFHDVYVASVAVYASYTQLLQAFIEAEAFDGPSVVVAYLPYFDASKDDALAVLQETKRAVDTGYWPLYRYNPKLNDEDSFRLDSYTVKKSLRQFLDRENKLTLLSKRSPQFARDLVGGHGHQVRTEQARKARDAYAKLLEGLSGPPVVVLFASDGGQAESVARRLARRAKGRGLKASVGAFDDFEADDLVKEPNVIFVTSTAGQGELPQNGRNLWEALKGGDFDFSNTKVGVFGMGDSQYWPRKQDKHYYNKPSKDLWARLQLLGAQELVPLGLGDDQDADGWSTGYNEWEPLVWTALGVDNVAAADEPPPITNEDIKLASNYLRGTIAEGLVDKSTGAISAHDQQLTKFHGIYMQDDRDVRDQRKAEGLEPAYSFMVRVRLPGCISSPEQWLRMDELSDTHGNGTFKITTRGTFQLHGVIKEDLKSAIRGMNAVLLDTVAACGDVDRNVVAAAIPVNHKLHSEVAKDSYLLSEHLLPRTTSYYEIWLEGEDDRDQPGDREAWENRKDGCTKKTKTQVAGSTIEDHEPLYGDVYLPRKFKINVAVPPYNDVDVYGHDIGLVAIVDKEKNEVIGYNVNVGGGMGTTHNNKKTYPRMGSCIGYAPRDKILEVCEKVMLVQRDNGDRKNRKHARLKYTVDDMTHDGFKEAVEKYLGYALESKRDHPAFTTNVDTYGWVTDEAGFHHFTTFVENGRVEDTPELQHRTGFREIAKYLKGSKAEFRLTANQHILISDLVDEQLPKVKELLAQYKLDNLSFSGLRLSSAACVAFPTCGLAMAESERYLPILITKLESILEKYGLRHDSIVMRMTGCPNGCARPWLAEIACVGKAFGAYNLYLGGGHVGNRLNKLYRSSLNEAQILETLEPMFRAWAHERQEGEPFGDFVIRKGYISATREGKDWWENVEPGVE